MIGSVMINSRSQIFCLIAALALIAIPRPGSAATAIAGCKAELVAEGRRSDPGSAEEKAADALKLSIAKWAQLAQGLHGSQFADWESAKERKIECEYYEQPGFNGRVSCAAIALPCEKR
jgi:hypothetical protein